MAVDGELIVLGGLLRMQNVNETDKMLMKELKLYLDKNFLFSITAHKRRFQLCQNMRHEIIHT